jgi:hypothetical protein
VKGSKSLRVQQDVSQGCNTVEAKQFLLRRGDFEFQREAVSSMETWEISGCLHGISVDRGVRFFPFILLCINSSFP